MNRRSEGRLSSRPTSAPGKAPLRSSWPGCAVWKPWRLSIALVLLASPLCLPHFSRALAAPAGLPDTSKMNLLFIIIEDCYAGVWGSYGNPICKTPNMDRFARTAVQFDAAYVQAVCCNPTRTSAVAEHKEFKGNVAFVSTRAFWRPKEQSPSGQGYHWNSNAETYYLIGEAMGEAMKRLLGAQ